MDIKKIAGGSISGIVVLVAMIAISIFTGDKEMLDRLIETALKETIAILVDDAGDGEEITLVIGADGDSIRNSGTLQLMGGLDFTGKKGDAITFRKRGDIWVETNRTLAEERDFQ